MPAASSSSSGAGGTKMSSTEKKIHHIALHARNSTILVNDIGDQLGLDASEVMLAANSLLKKNLVSMQHTDRGMQLLAVSRSEASMMGSLAPEEGMIYKQIKDSGNEGIWTKALKARTNLHQTILTRVLKALENRQLIKAVKSVKNPTRKIYMLYNLTPSVELSGGPWYTDNELDVPFINGLSQFCHYYIQQQTWPDGYQSSRQKLYPASHTNRLPTAPRILKELKDKQVTSTSLSVGEMQQLLETLVYDEKIEKVPMPGGTVDPSAHEATVKSDDEDSDWGGGKKSRDNGASSRSSSKSRKKGDRRAGGSRSPTSGTDSGSESSSGSSGSDDGRKSKKRKRSESRKTSSKSAKRSKKSSSSRTSRSSRDRSTSAASSGSEEESDDDSILSDDRRSSKGRSSKTKSDSTKGSKSRPTAKYTGPEFLSDEDDDQDVDDEDVSGGDNSSWGAQNWVYRALRPVEVPLGFTETPCARCPVSDFCRPRGPVNAEDCVYYDDWMDGAWSDSEEEEEDDKGRIRAREKKQQQHANGTA
ncbi:hypothetical protein BCV69DRAFT_254797 [Microstroma glucosiphilum]|uniref:RNA polymerase III subunit C6 n=1 Tax=Pseudomicrostroma glucosiphilum TaxID=1684307 RepID=A0A316UFG1_9BASI|nr:hypothetical protein BCV69DRAFT_254797 [Pseudomicrostroma glucosiphilum]PWN23982.1 hypothetical protein BCV69DRAFT_254797 [Pseudomicrostroma glucosiphilum]